MTKVPNPVKRKTMLSVATVRRKCREEARRIIESTRPRPWFCDVCSRSLYKFGNRGHEANVHHRDQDWENNEPSNLSLRCKSCHSCTWHTKSPKKTYTKTYPDNTVDSSKYMQKFFADPETFIPWYRKRFGKDPANPKSLAELRKNNP